MTDNKAPELEPDAEVWMVDLDGTGSMHPASKGDPGAMRYVRADLQCAVKPLELAVMFHTAYEELAPSFGYETRKDTKQFDANSANGKLMAAVCQRILSALTTAPVTPEQAARFVIEYVERETGVPFGDRLGLSDIERIRAIAGGERHE